MTKIAIRVVSHRLVNPSLLLMMSLAQLWGLNLTWATLHFVGRSWNLAPLFDRLRKAEVISSIRLAAFQASSWADTLYETTIS